MSSPTPDTDVDVAIIDTGIGPVGGNELNVAGGINCAADGLPADQWQDLYEVGHGTHVAGTIGARDGNGVGVVGVAPGARLWAVRVFDQGGWGDESTVLCGLDWVTSTRVPGAAPPGSQPIDVVNMSIEGSRFSYTEECLPGDPDPIHVAVCAADRGGHHGRGRGGQRCHGRQLRRTGRLRPGHHGGRHHRLRRRWLG